MEAATLCVAILLRLLRGRAWVGRFRPLSFWRGMAIAGTMPTRGMMCGAVSLQKTCNLAGFALDPLSILS
jgi:hypothetical protein